MITTQIPTQPTYADVILPQAPTINVPTLSVDDLTEPIFTNPTTSLQTYVYEKYASALNNLLNSEIEELFTWTGDDILFNAESNKAQDDIALKYLSDISDKLDDTASRGFILLPGATRDNILQLSIKSKQELQKQGVGSQSEITDIALKFINWASQAGATQVKVGVDENKQIVYANMAAVEAMASTLVNVRKQQLSVFNDKISIYYDKLNSIKTSFLQQNVDITTYDAGVDKAIANIDKTDTLLDEKHAENLGVSITNASTILDADLVLQEASIEKQKVLNTHAILAGYLARIKEAHAGLASNRAEVDIVLADLDFYKKQTQQATQQANNILSELSSRSRELNQYYRQSMSQVSKAKAEITAAGTTSDGVRYSSKLTSEGYRKQLKEALVNLENTDLTTLTNNDNSISSWMSNLEGSFTEKLSRSNANRSANSISLSSQDTVTTDFLNACAAYNQALEMSRSDTTLNLDHRII